jgi:hypothetical protein
VRFEEYRPAASCNLSLDDHKEAIIEAVVGFLRVQKPEMCSYLVAGVEILQGFGQSLQVVGDASLRVIHRDDRQRSVAPAAVKPRARVRKPRRGMMTWVDIDMDWSPDLV